MREEHNETLAINAEQLLDVRDGLNRKQRVILSCLRQLQQERGGRSVPTAMLYGRVVEIIDVSAAEMQSLLGVLGDDTTTS